MKLIRLLSTIGVCLLQFSCATPKSYLTFSDWDSDSNKLIKRREFVEAYSSLNYFDKWGHGKGSITYPELFTATFQSMDRDQSNSISAEEFSAQIKLFFFGMFNGSFGAWDSDASGSLSSDEFISHIRVTNFGSLWDENSDKRVSEKEMAGGMFYVCDINNDGSVDESELSSWKRNR
ncbi:hypothetical protein WSM22_40680 [Cytophagales bacterium WSM2-2]|nr:hypothetical protein WSM22_40680 [Cytophagales bacterium WSM2-2]